MRKAITSVLMIFLLSLVSGAGRAATDEEQFAQLRATMDASIKAVEGDKLQEAGNLDAASNMYEEALKQHPQCTLALAGRARLRVRTGQLKLALADFDLVITLSPDVARFYEDRAKLKRTLSDYTGAIQDLTIAIKLEPNYGFNYYARAKLYKRVGDKPAATSDLVTAINLYSQQIAASPPQSFRYGLRGAVYQESLRAHDRPATKW